jgi:hypothetical protein
MDFVNAFQQAQADVHSLTEDVPEETGQLDPVLGLCRGCRDRGDPD